MDTTGTTDAAAAAISSDSTAETVRMLRQETFALRSNQERWTREMDMVRSELEREIRRRTDAGEERERALSTSSALQTVLNESRTKTREDLESMKRETRTKSNVALEKMQRVEELSAENERLKKDLEERVDEKKSETRRRMVEDEELKRTREEELDNWRVRVDSERKSLHVAEEKGEELMSRTLELESLLSKMDREREESEEIVERLKRERDSLASAVRGRERELDTLKKENRTLKSKMSKAGRALASEVESLGEQLNVAREGRASSTIKLELVQRESDDSLRKKQMELVLLLLTF